MTGLFINVSVRVYGFFVFLPGNHHKVFPTQLIGFFRQIAAGVHRRRRPEVVMLPTLVRFIFATSSFLDLFRGECAEREGAYHQRCNHSCNKFHSLYSP